MIIVNIFSYSQVPSYYDEGSTIVCIGRNDTIWIGADSKITNTKGIVQPNRCKIIKTDSLVFAHAGIFTDFSTNIDIDSLFIHNINEKASTIKNVEVLNSIFIYISQFLGIFDMFREKYTIGDTLRFPLGVFLATNIMAV